MPFVARYTHSFEDYLTLIHARRELARFGRRGRYALWLFIYLAAMLWMSPGLLNPGVWSWQLAAIIFGGGLLAMIAVLVSIDLLFDRLVYRAQYTRLSIARQPVENTVAEDGLHWKTPQSGGKLDWSAVIRMISMPEATVLFMSRVEGVVLPARAFASPQAYAEATGFMRSRIGVDAQQRTF